MIEIYGTLGPKCSDRETLEKMFEEGMTGIRLNLSHTSLAQSSQMLKNYHEAACAKQVKADLLIDMQGPELRLPSLVPMVLHNGQQILLGEGEQLPVPAFIVRQLQKEDTVLLDDGKVELKIEEADGKSARAVVQREGTIVSRKSIKVSGKNIYGPILTEADRENLRMAKEYGVTAIMQPFVRNGEDLRRVRQVMRECGVQDLRIFAKIENLEGASNLDSILEEADMIVIARGDLGNDMPLWHLPKVQKEIEDACRKKGTPFMVVTQMLASMCEHPVPTRAEVSDIFNAAADGASAVMVTNETAAGKYPAEVIRYLVRTAAEGEAYRKGE